MIARAVPFAIGLALTVAYVPGWGGAATTPRWDIGAAMALALLLGPAGRMTHAHWLGLALAGWLILSLAWSSSPLDGAGQAVMLLVIAVAFAWGATLGDIRPFVAGAAIGLAISSVIAVAQWLGWHGIETATITPAGLFYSHNRFGEVAAVVFAAAVGLRMWWALPGLAPALVLPMDRGAWIAAGVVLAIVAWRRARTFERYVGLMIVAWMAVLAALILASADMPWKLAALAERVTIWQFAVMHLDWFGNGLGAFINDGPVLAWPVSEGSRLVNVTRAEHPHNEFLWLGYEGGGIALCLGLTFVLAIGRCVSRGSSDLGLVFVALGLIGCVAMPFHDPATIGMASVLAGFAVGAHHRAAVAADVGRNALRAWVEAELGQGRECCGAGTGGEPVPVPAAVS